MHRSFRVLALLLLLTPSLFADTEESSFIATLYSLPAVESVITYVVDVYDGDTCTVIQKIWGEGKDEAVFVLKKIRLYGIDASELRTTDLNEKERGYAARDFVRARILYKPIRLEMMGREKFGRYMAVLFYKDNTGNEINLNQELIAAGHAHEYFGGKRSYDDPYNDRED